MTHENTEHNRNGIATVAAVEPTAPMPGILSRFMPRPKPAFVPPVSAEFTVETRIERTATSAENLAPAERYRLMDACADECNAAYRGGRIDWAAVDRINSKIGTTFTRSELISLLSEYKETITAHHD